MKLDIKTKCNRKSLLIIVAMMTAISVSTINLFADTAATKPATKSVKTTTTKPVITESPKQLAINFVQKTEQILSAEAKGDRKQTENIKSTLSGKVANETVDALAARYGHGTANMSSEKVNELQKILIGAWAAIINYYQDHIDYSKAKTITLPLREDKNAIAHVIIPTNGPAYPSLNNIVVVCIKEKDEWKVKLIDLRPNLNTKKQH